MPRRSNKSKPTPDQISYLALDQLTPYARNPRRNESAVAKVKASIAEFGFKQPIVVDAKHVIIAGHTRFLAAQSLGLATVPVIVARDLTPTQVKAYRLADNRVAQESQWDDELLALELEELQAAGFDVPVIGFNDLELDRLLAEEDLEPIEAGEGESTTGAVRQYLSFGDERIPLADDELAILTTRLKAYIDERGAAIGFARALCAASRNA